MTKDIQAQLEQIEKEKQALLERQAALAEEARYGERVAAMQNLISKIKSGREADNARVTAAFKALSADAEVAGMIELVEQTITERIGSYYLEHIKPEDQVTAIEVTQLTIKTQFGIIGATDVDRDGWIQPPYSIAKQSRKLKPETVIRKLKEAATQAVAKQTTKNKLEQAAAELTTEFRTKYPGSTIKVGQEWKSNIYVRGNGYNIDIIQIDFANGSMVKLRYDANKMYSIIEKRDHRMNNMDRDAMIDYLAG
jgi:hypothetical protein